MMAPEPEIGKNPDVVKAPRFAHRRNKETVSKKRSKIVAKNNPIDLKSQLKGAAGIRNGRVAKGGQNKIKNKPQVSVDGNKIRVNLGGHKKNKENNKQDKLKKLKQFALKNWNYFDQVGWVIKILNQTQILITMKQHAEQQPQNQ